MSQVQFSPKEKKVGGSGNISCGESQTGEENLCKMLERGHESTLWLKMFL